MTNSWRLGHLSKGQVASLLSRCQCCHFQCSFALRGLPAASCNFPTAHLCSFWLCWAPPWNAGPGHFTLLGRGGKQSCQGANSALPRPHWAQPHLATPPSAPRPRATSPPLLSSTSHKGITEKGTGRKKDRVKRMGSQILCQQPPARENQEKSLIFGYSSWYSCPSSDWTAENKNGTKLLSTTPPKPRHQILFHIKAAYAFVKFPGI